MIKYMEKNEGLHTLSQTERDILYAATDVAGEDGEFVAHDLARHTLARDISHATYHRAFKSLLAKGFMKPARGFKTRNYVLQEVQAQGFVSQASSSLSNVSSNNLCLRPFPQTLRTN